MAVLQVETLSFIHYPNTLILAPVHEILSIWTSPFEPRKVKVIQLHLNKHGWPLEYEPAQLQTHAHHLYLMTFQLPVRHLSVVKFWIWRYIRLMFMLRMMWRSSFYELLCLGKPELGVGKESQYMGQTWNTKTNCESNFVSADNDVEGWCRPSQWINADQPGSLEGRPCSEETVKCLTLLGRGQPIVCYMWYFS